VDYQQLEEQSFPEEIKTCEFTEPLCNKYIKIRNIKVIQPYNFFMSPEQWAEVEAKNGLEFRLALKFGLENDMRFYSDALTSRLSFHTMMYIKFAEYVRRNSLNEVKKLVTEFQSATFKARTTSIFSAANIMTVKGLVEKAYLVEEAYIDIRQLLENNGPLTITRTLYKNIFHEDYDNQVVDLYKNQGIYFGESNNEIYRKLGY
jgi:hypothetical protein